MRHLFIWTLGLVLTMAVSGHAKAASIPGKIPIIMYHSISTNPKDFAHAAVSPKKFRGDMEALVENGYTPIFFEDYVDATEGKTLLPDKPIFITFDDGYLNNYTYAYPILKELNMKATISIIGWSVGCTLKKNERSPTIPHFTWEQAKEMYDSGVIDIQHHTFDLHNESDKKHYGKGVLMLPKESEVSYRKRFKDDVLKLKSEIESHIGNRVIVFTYPYGNYNLLAEQILKEVGIQFSLSTHPGLADFSKSNYLLNRINVTQDLNSKKLIKTLETLQDKHEEGAT